MLPKTALPSNPKIVHLNCMTTWYQTSPLSLVLYEVRVVRESANNVWIAMHGIERKEKRHSLHSDYWPTLDEAVAVLKKQAEKIRLKATEELQKAQEVLNAIADREVRLREKHSQELLPSESDLEL